MKRIAWFSAFALCIALIVAGWPPRGPQRAFGACGSTIALTGAGCGAPGGAAAYVGPGDIVSGASAWWGLRCYNAAYSGNMADVFAPADASHTLLTCSTGGVINETLQALSITCAVSCTVKTLYDQSGANSCTSGTSVCNLTNATIGNRPALTLNCLGTKPCMTFAAASSQDLLSPVNFPVTAQPTTMSLVANTTNNAARQEALAANNQQTFAFRWVANNTVALTSNNVFIVSSTDGAWRALQGVFNGPNCILNIDGTSNTGDCGTLGINGQLDMGSNIGANFFNGQTAEGGLWLGTFSGTQLTNMCHNQFTYWGTAVSC